MAKLAESSATLTSTSYVLLTCSPAGVTPLPRQAMVYNLTVDMTSLLTGATLTVKVTRDLGGDHATTPEKAITIVTGETTSDDASVSTSVNTVLETDRTAFYIWAKLDAGSCQATGKITWDYAND